MAKLRQKVSQVLRNRLIDSHDKLLDCDSGHVVGVVVSSTFKSMPFAKRQKLLTKIFQESLTIKEQTVVGPIAALTPAEASTNAADFISM